MNSNQPKQNGGTTRQPRPEERVIGPCFLAGMILSGIAIFAPDAGAGPGAFFNLAMQTTWQRLFEMEAAWCSLKIILLGLGLALILNGFGLTFASPKRKPLAVAVLIGQAALLCGSLAGGFFFVKALL